LGGGASESPFFGSFLGRLSQKRTPPGGQKESWRSGSDGFSLHPRIKKGAFR